MRKAFFIFLFAFASNALGSDSISLPAEGNSSAESILKCESQIASLKSFQQTRDKMGTGYKQINPGSDSYVYVFTTSAEPAHPAMIKITLHPMVNPRSPQDKEVEFFGSYAGKEEDFLAWGRRVTYDLGRGFATGVMKDN